MKIASWNVNSIRVRLPHVQEWLDRAKPDILGLQELKMTSDTFPEQEIKAHGYHSVSYGQKTYNGVALLSRQEPVEISRGLPNYRDEQRRVIAANYGDTRVINLYVPNAFTPNDDGLNETFFPMGTGFDRDNDFIFTIYDRWGQVIFTSYSVDDGWDGTARDKGGSDLVQEGVYVWRIELKEATRISEEKHRYVGRVTLLK